MISLERIKNKILGIDAELLFDQDEEKKAFLVCEPIAADLRERFGLTDKTKQFRVTPYVSWHVLQGVVYGKTSNFELIGLMGFQLNHHYVANQLTYIGSGYLAFEDCETISRNLRTGEIFVASFSETMDDSIVRNGGANMRRPCLIIRSGEILSIDNKDTYMKLILRSQEYFPMVCQSNIEDIDLETARLAVRLLEPMPQRKKAPVVERKIKETVELRIM